MEVRDWGMGESSNCRGVRVMISEPLWLSYMNTPKLKSVNFYYVTLYVFCMLYVSVSDARQISD